LERAALEYSLSGLMNSFFIDMHVRHACLQYQQESNSLFLFTKKGKFFICVDVCHKSYT
jgi:hypothetical protein